MLDEYDGIFEDVGGEFGDDGEVVCVEVVYLDVGCVGCYGLIDCV